MNGEIGIEHNPQLKEYIRAYLAAWLDEESWPDNEGSRQQLKDIHDHWAFYVARGVYETEAFYERFLEKNGVICLPDFIRLMDKLQGPKNCIFQTDDDPRCVPFPPAFQAAVLKWAKSGICAQDGSCLETAVAIFTAMKDVGMHRLHQSSLLGDFHVMSIAEWIRFLESLQDDTSGEKRSARLKEEEGLALIRSWLTLDCDFSEISNRYSWKFTHENELERKKLPSPNTWHHYFRDFSATSFMRCLETTGAEHLRSLLIVGYAFSPTKFHYSLGHGDRYDVFVTPAFEHAIEQFLEHTSIPDKEKQLEYVGKALAFLARTGVKEFESGFDVGCWADILCRDVRTEGNQPLG